MKTKKTASIPSLPSSPPVPAPHSVAHDIIAERAQAIWRERGSPAGHDLEHWLEAERQLYSRGGRSRVRDTMEPGPADFSPDADNALKDRVDKDIDRMDEPPAQRSATSL